MDIFGRPFKGSRELPDFLVLLPACVPPGADYLRQTPEELVRHPVPSVGSALWLLLAGFCQARRLDGGLCGCPHLHKGRLQHAVLLLQLEPHLAGLSLQIRDTVGLFLGLRLASGELAA